MSAHMGHIAKKPAREIFLTSSSLSFSSLSSSCASFDDVAIYTNTKDSRPSCREEQNKEHSKAYSQSSEISDVTQVRIQTPPSRLGPMNKGYDPDRISASVFGNKNGDLNWSDESLFSLRMSNCQGSRQSCIKIEDVLMSPCLLVKPEDGEDKRLIVEETTSVVDINNIHQEKSSLSTSHVSLQQSYQEAHTKDQSFPLDVGERKSKKRSKKIKKAKKQIKTKKEKKTTKKEKKTKKEKEDKKEKKKMSKCWLWSWLFSRISKGKCASSCCFKCRKCNCCCNRKPKDKVL